MKQALIVSTVSGFLLKFEKDNVKLLQRMGYRIHYAANMNEQFYVFRQEELTELDVQPHHIDVARSPYMFRWNIRALNQLVRIVRENYISLIHCHEPMGGVLGRLAAMMSGNKVQVAYTAHGFHFFRGAPLINNTLYYAVEYLLARFTDELILINREDRIVAERFQLRSGGGVWQIPGVGLDPRFQQIPGPEEWAQCRKKHGIRKDQFVLMSVGELNANKNHQVILRALKELKERGDLPVGFFYGICGDGFLRERLREMILEFGLSDTVRLFGYCTDVREYLAMADAVAFPSVREGLGMAALEALAMGIPVLAADNRGTREYMCSGRNGFVCAWDNAHEFAERLLELYVMEQQEREEMSRCCAQSAKGFSRVYTDAVMEQVYTKLNAKVEKQ